MRKLTTALAVVCLLIGLVAGAASAGPGGADRPYKSRGTGTIVIDPVAGTVTFTNVQNSTHLGRNTSEGTGLFNPSGGTYVVNQVAANGDVLYVTIQSTATIISPTEFRLVNQTTFNGGTGRFADASGTAVGYVTAVADPANPLVYYSTFTVEGTISY
jgi:hypothetical protein